MRLPIHPGRGGRGHPSFPKPKYLSHNDHGYSSDRFGKNYNSFSVLDDKIKDQSDKSKISQNPINDNKPQCSNDKNIKIPDSNVNRPIEPAPENGLLLHNGFIPISRKKRRKKKIKKLTPSNYYKLETIEEEKKEFDLETIPNCEKNYWFTMATDTVMEERAERFDNDDVEMSDNREPNLNQSVWDKIQIIVKQLGIQDLEINEKDSEETLKLYLEKLQAKQTFHGAFNMKKNDGLMLVFYD